MYHVTDMYILRTGKLQRTIDIDLQEKEFPPTSLFSTTFLLILKKISHLLSYLE